MIEEFKKTKASKLWLSMFVLFLAIIDISCLGAKSLKKGEEFKEKNGGAIRVISSDEVEIEQGGGILLGKYTVDGERVRVVVNQVVTLIQYYKITPDGLVEEKDGTIYYSKAAFAVLEEKRKFLQAVANGNTELTKTLLDKGADVNAKNEDGNTASIVAAETWNTEIIKMLLAKGADVNAKNLAGNTVLMFAVEKNNVEIVRMLLDKGADVSIKDNNGHPVFDYAKNPEMREMLNTYAAQKKK